MLSGADEIGLVDVVDVVVCVVVEMLELEDVLEVLEFKQSPYFDACIFQNHHHYHNCCCFFFVVWMATCFYAIIYWTWPFDIPLHLNVKPPLSCLWNEGLGLFEGICVQNTGHLVNICIPFFPTGVNGIIDASNPFIKELLFCSSNNIETSWVFDGTFESQTDWSNILLSDILR